MSARDTTFLAKAAGDDTSFAVVAMPAGELVPEASLDYAKSVPRQAGEIQQSSDPQTLLNLFKSGNVMSIWSWLGAGSPLEPIDTTDQPATLVQMFDLPSLPSVFAFDATDPQQLDASATIASWIDRGEVSKPAHQAPTPITAHAESPSENDRITGTRYADNIDGGRGKDIIDGGDGDDTISGGQDIDHLTGGAGADQFVFAPLSERDVIADFEDGTDLIDLSAYASHGITEFSDLSFYQIGPSTIIQIMGADSIVLDAIGLNLIGIDDFLF